MTELPAPQAVPGCPCCAEFSDRLAATAPQTSAWSDVRVLRRRHHAADHSSATTTGGPT
ncbi:hypothetical protein ACFW1A_28055 [Kitasatospora sp. NPDC058965]|uniref:hypothetical protein n=1 Tax=Kitasatospora sp. NPDC058965 TaxID=3346682 RepID=UPI0036BE2D78